MRKTGLIRLAIGVTHIPYGDSGRKHQSSPIDKCIFNLTRFVLRRCWHQRLRRVGHKIIVAYVETRAKIRKLSIPQRQESQPLESCTASPVPGSLPASSSSSDSVSQHLLISRET